MCPSSVQAFIEEELPPELLDFTEELLLESVDGLDFAEEELFFDEDETPLPLDLPPLLLLESSSLLEAELLVEISPADSGATPEEDSSSPQAVKDIVMANSAKARNLHTFIRSSSMQKSVIAYTQQSRP
jgi:hypothetical protein